MRRRVAVALCLAVALSGCGGDRTEGRTGAELFEVSCAGCHLGDGSGGLGPALDAGSNAASLSDEQIARVIRVGPGTMPAFDRLTDAQIDSIVTHVRALQ